MNNFKPSALIILLLLTSTIALWAGNNINEEEIKQKLRSGEISIDEIVMEIERGNIDDPALIAELRDEYPEIRFAHEADEPFRPVSYAEYGANEMNLFGYYNEDLPASGRNGSYLGERLVSIGDFNNDGYDDWAAGLRDAAKYPTAERVGKVYIYFGGTALSNESDPDLILEGDEHLGEFGDVIAGLGDVNGDGISDFGVVYNHNYLYIYFGSSSPGSNPDITLNCGSTISDIANAGDVNNDGYTDIICGAATSNKTYIFYGGPTLADGASPDVELSGDSGTYFGYTVSGAGDVNNDGYADVLITATRFNSYTGRVYLYFGGENLEESSPEIFDGEVTGDFFGFAVSGVGDANDDGYDDILIGAYYNDTNGSNSGLVYFYPGGISPSDSTPLTFTGNAIVYQDFGFSLAEGEHDVNNDGIPDLIIGTNSRGNTNNGVYIYFGGSSLKDSVAIVLDNDEYASYIGCSVACGDFDGDGQDDIITGGNRSRENGYDSGRLYLFYGGAALDADIDVYMSGERSGERLGNSVACAGDVNGDGYDDMITGSDDLGSEGVAYIFFGGPGADMEPDITLTGLEDASKFGSSVAGAGDVNGDGYDDVVIGAYFKNKAYIYFGGASMDTIPDLTLAPEISGGHFGYSVSGAGDVNGDGYDDVIIGAEYSDETASNAGSAYIYYGSASMDSVADVALYGEAGYDYFGCSVSGAGDVNGDGYDDVVIGAYQNDNTASNAGSAYIFFGGSAMDNTADIIFDGKNSNDNLGKSVSGAGDVNGDGYDDVIIGVHYDDAGGINSGSAYIFYGGDSMDNSADIILSGDLYNQYFGYSVSGAGDINNDGYDDVIVSIRDTSKPGKISVFLGGSAMDAGADIVITSSMRDNAFGKSIAGIGDFNADGIPDIAVGEADNSAVGAYMGRFYIYYNDPFFSVGTDSIVTDLNSGTINFTIDANIAWTVSCEESWVTIDAGSGGADTVKVTVEASAEQRRTADIVIASSLDTVTVKLIQKNNPPRLVYSPEDVALSEEASDTVVIYGMFSDSDNALTLGITNLSDTLFSAEIINDSLLTIKATENANGSGAVIITASDGWAQTSDTINVTVLGVNDAPIIEFSTDTVWIASDSTLLLSDLYSIEDTEDSLEDLTVTATSDAENLEFTYNSEEGALELKVTDNWGGEATVYVEVEDSEGAAATDSIVVVVTAVTGISGEENGVPAQYVLNQNYPNPFNPVTHIRFGLPRAGKVRITVYNVLGQKVAVLTDKTMTAGYHTVSFEASRFSSGLYFYRLEADGRNLIKKMLLIE